MKGLNFGKILAILCGLLAVLLIVFLMNSGSTSSNTKSGANTATSEATSASSNSNLDAENSQILAQNSQNGTQNSFASDEDLKKIKALEKSVRKAPENLSKLYLVRCAPCHFKDGKGDIAPSIAGKSKDEVAQKLRSYKAGRESNELMNALSKNLSENEIELLANEISQFK